MYEALLHPRGTVAVDTDARPIEQAVARGYQAPTPGRAFVAGYRAALQRLFDRDAAALCVTEAGGNHPRAIETSLVEGRLNGTKQWATDAQGSDVLLVLATAGETDGRKDLRVCAVSPDAVRFESMPPTPFTPDVPHYQVHLEDCIPEEVLPGDGWSTWVKPFRTVEDIHVYGALMAWLLGSAEWDVEIQGEVLADLYAISALADADPLDPVAHIALHHVLERARERVLHLPWGDEPEARLWARDQALLKIGTSARVRRYERARSAVQ